MTITFKGAVFNGANQALTIETLTLDENPGRGEVLVRMVASGVCHSDLHVLNGDWTLNPPLVLGHEGAGEVISVGEGVTDVEPGDHVVLTWTPPCGKCEFCVAGRPALCQAVREQAYENVFEDGQARLKRGEDDVYSYLAVGSFAEYAMVSERTVVKVRPDVPLVQACLVGCAVTTGIGAATRTARIEAGSTVLVVGAGGVGINIVQGAHLAGASKIIVADITKDKLEMARKFGATDTVNSKENDLHAKVMAMTGGRGVDYAFEAIGIPQMIEAAHSCTARGATTVIVGQVAEGKTISIDPFQMSDEEKRIIGSNYGSCRPSIDIPRLLDLYAEGRVNLDDLVSDRVPLTDINEAFERMKTGAVLRTVIDYTL